MIEIFCGGIPIVAARLLEVNVVEAIGHSGLIGKTCLIIIAVFSILSWAVIAFKYFQIRNATKQSNTFLDECVESGAGLHSAFKQAGNYPGSPLGEIMRDAYLELELENWFQDYKKVTVHERVEIARSAIERVMERTITHEIQRMESYLVFLATTAAVAPFIGLFGTVWGILGAFQGMVAVGSPDIATLGPGISTALTTTVAGLMAAIPAVIFYNYLTNKIQSLVVLMDAFSAELINVIQRTILKQGA